MNETNSDKEQGRFARYIRNLFDFSSYSKKTIIYIIIFVILIVLSLFLLWYIYLGGGEHFLLDIIVNWFINPIAQLGFIGILLFIVIMAIQGLLVPIPSELVLLATGMIWGLFWGGFMGIIGSMSAALLCFYVSRKGGRPLAEKFVGKSAINLADRIIQKYGIWAIIIARFLPFVAFDPISYASGLLNESDKSWIKKYAIGSLIGSIPRAFFYSYLGNLITIQQGIVPPFNLGDLDLTTYEALSNTFNFTLLIVLGILVVIFIIYYVLSKILEKRHNQQKQ